jgi:hypothetical protein
MTLAVLQNDVTVGLRSKIKRLIQSSNGIILDLTQSDPIRIDQIWSFWSDLIRPDPMLSCRSGLISLYPTLCISPDQIWSNPTRHGPTWSNLVLPDLIQCDPTRPDPICSDLIRTWSDLIRPDLTWIGLIWPDLIWSDWIWPDLTGLTQSDPIRIDPTWSVQVPIISCLISSDRPDSSWSHLILPDPT